MKNKNNGCSAHMFDEFTPGLWLHISLWALWFQLFLSFAFYVSTGAEEMSTGTNTNTPPKERRTVSKTARFTALAEFFIPIRRNMKQSCRFSLYVCVTLYPTSTDAGFKLFSVQSDMQFIWIMSSVVLLRNVLPHNLLVVTFSVTFTPPPVHKLLSLVWPCQQLYQTPDTHLN